MTVVVHKSAVLRRIATTLMILLAQIDGASVCHGDEANFRLFDGFEKRLELKWQPVRPDPDHVSLTANPGKLTITTQRGTIGFNETRPGSIPALNLYLIRNPAEGGGDFVLTTCIESFQPTKRYQQAGLLVYDDDDNYLKYDMEFSGTGMRFKYMRETDGLRVLATDQVVPDTPRRWMRITKRGRVYERAFSIDGVTYVTDGEKGWGDGAPKWVGIVAKNGMAAIEGTDAVFDFFECRSLTDAEENDLRYVDRKKLQGAWRVVAGQFDGMPLEEGAFSDFVFEGGHVTFSEGSQTHRADFELEPERDPKGIMISALSSDANRPAKGIYKLDGQTLEICLSVDPLVKRPTEFMSTRGDTRLLIQLEKADSPSQ